MQQPTTPMMPLMPSSFPPCNITTDQIQKYLDENKKLILAILDNQNLGKLAECAQYQAQLQKNLMYLAAIADAQPQVATTPTTQVPQHPMQQGPYLMSPTMAQQGVVFPPRMPGQFASPLQHHEQAMMGQMNFRPMEASLRTSANDIRGGNKQEAVERGSSGDGLRNAGVGGVGGEGSDGGK